MHEVPIFPIMHTKNSEFPYFKIALLTVLIIVECTLADVFFMGKGTNVNRIRLKHCVKHCVYSRLLYPKNKN